MTTQNSTHGIMNAMVDASDWTWNECMRAVMQEIDDACIDAMIAWVDAWQAEVDEAERGWMDAFEKLECARNDAWIDSFENEYDACMQAAKNYRRLAG